MRNILDLFSIDLRARRIFGLDLLRCLAIIFVLLGHARFQIPALVNNKLYMLVVIDGVTIFFVLSGYLIGGILIKEVEKNRLQQGNLLNFWIRRWFRTIPIYFVVLSVSILISIVYYNEFDIEFLKYYFFIQNFSSPHPGFFPEAWSLAIEEWFYLIFAFGLFISFFTLSVKVDNRKVILFWIVFIILLSTAVRTQRAISYNCTDLKCWADHIRQNVVTRLDSLMFGVLVAYLQIYRVRFFRLMQQQAIFLFGIVLIVTPQIYDFFIGDMFFKSYMTFPCTTVGSLMLIPRLIILRPFNSCFTRLITVTSLISYSMYLLNYSFIGKFMLTDLWKTFNIAAFSGVGIFKYFLFWALTYLLAILSYKYIEIPTTKWREKIS